MDEDYPSLHDLAKNEIHLLELVSTREIPMAGGRGTTLYCTVRHLNSGRLYRDTSCESGRWPVGTKFTSEWDGRSSVFPRLARMHATE